METTANDKNFEKDSPGVNLIPPTVFYVCLVSGSLWLFALYLPLAFYLALCVVPREEAYMEREFGNEYRLYLSKVRRWI